MAEHNEPLTREVLEKRSGFCHTNGITLDGKPAVISGYRNSFAKVTQLSTGLSAEWSWEAVERIVAKGGKFKS
jgi:hypothetical protein